MSKETTGKMSMKNYLLICLSEECAEVQKEISKALRFGLDDFDPDDTNQISNFAKIEKELTDINVVIKTLEDFCDLKFNLHNEESKHSKRIKLIRYMYYSRQRNCLQQEDNE